MPDHPARKLATVLFADLVDSTAAAGEQDRERTRGRLERFYDAMSTEIAAAGGTVERFAGDAVLGPFRLRALGIVRADDGLLARADERFRALGLDWHADQTD